MKRARYSFTVSEHDTEIIERIENLKNNHELSKVIYRMFYLYSMSPSFQNIVKDIKTKNESKQLARLDEILQDTRLYEKLGISRSTIEAHRTNGYLVGYQNINNNNIDEDSVYEMSQPRVNSNQNTNSIPDFAEKASKPSKNPKEVIDVDVVLEDETDIEGEDAGDDFDFFDM